MAAPRHARVRPTPRPRRPIPPREGFSLLEIVLATVVLGTALVIVAEGINQGLWAASWTAQQQVAHRLASESLARVRAQPAAALPTEGTEDIGQVTYRWRVESMGAGPAGSTRVVSTVTWTRRNETVQLRLDGLLGGEGLP